MITSVSKYSRYMVTYQVGMTKEQFEELGKPASCFSDLQTPFYTWISNQPKPFKFKVSVDNPKDDSDGFTYELSFGFLDKEIYERFKEEFKCITIL